MRLPRTGLEVQDLTDTSLIAIMLGRLRMSRAACEEAYIRLSDEIFSPHRRTMDPRRLTDLVNAEGKFDASILERFVMQKIREAGLEQNALLKDDRIDACHV